MQKPTCVIKCLCCKELTPSPIQYSDKESFLSSSLIGNKVTCQKCGKMTRCDKENMYFNPHDGTIHTGEDTMPEG